MNEISDRIFGTNYNKKRIVTFAENNIITYNLTKQERQMKKLAYKRVKISSRHYMRMDEITYMMNNLNINP